jgi:hypothetical protein
MGYTANEGWGFPVRQKTNIRKLEHCVSDFSLRNEEQEDNGKGTDGRRRG